MKYADSPWAWGLAAAYIVWSGIVQTYLGKKLGRADGAMLALGFGVSLVIGYAIGRITK